MFEDRRKRSFNYLLRAKYNCFVMMIFNLVHLTTTSAIFFNLLKHSVDVALQRVRDPLALSGVDGT